MREVTCLAAIVSEKDLSGETNGIKVVIERDGEWALADQDWRMEREIRCGDYDRLRKMKTVGAACWSLWLWGCGNF